MKSGICTFLKEIDRDFPTPLSIKVDIDEYSEKILDKAEILSVVKDGKIVACVILYCNDSDNRRAYIPLVGVLRQYRGLGYAKVLVQSAISMAKSRKFRTLGIHTESESALNLYQSIGFDICQDGYRKYLELKL